MKVTIKIIKNYLYQEVPFIIIEHKNTNFIFNMPEGTIRFA